MRKGANPGSLWYNLVRQIPAQELERMPVPSQSSSPLVHVLLVEQDADFLTALGAFLSEIKECSLQVCNSYRDVPERIRETEPQLVMLAHEPFSEEGVEVLTRIHNLFPDATLIVSFPSPDSDFMNLYRDLPVTAFLYKNENYIPAVRRAVKRALIEILLPAMAGPEIADSSSQSSDILSMLSTFSPGDTILHYRITEALGEGGMGEIYKAEDLKLCRPVALKVVPLRVIRDEIAKRRLIREARLASVLNHSNIVTIYSVEETGNLSVIVMEYVEGETLDRKIDRGSLGMIELLDIALQTTDALHAAHNVGLIHRDIKPQNIMLTPHGQVKLLDFGLAKRILSGETLRDDSALTNLTRPGIAIGTVAYMSPEQTRGEELDPRTDLFSLGCVLYQAATGKLPFEGPSILAIMHAIATSDPLPPSIIRNDLPKKFDLLIQRALAKEKVRRFNSASEFRDGLRELKEILLETSLAFTGMKGSLREREFQSRSRRSKTITSIAVLPFGNLSADPEMDYLGYGITESLLNSLSDLPNLRVVPRSTVFRYKDAQLDPQEIANKLNVRAIITGRVLHRGDALNIQAELIDAATNSQLWGAQFNRKLTDILLVQEEIAKEITDKLRLKLTGKQRKRLAKRYTENTKAYQAYLKGLYYFNRRSEEGFLKAIEYFHEAIQEDFRYALPHAGLADCYNLLGVYGFLPPRNCFPLAKAAAIKALEIEDSLAEAHASLASVERNYEWNWTAAEEEFRRAIEMNPNYATAHQWYGDLLTSIGRTEDGIREMNRALELDPLSRVVNTAVGRQFYYLRNYDAAIQQYRQTIDLDPNFSLAHFALSFAYKEKHMFEEAISEMKTAVRLSDRLPIMLGSLGHTYAVAGQREEAKKLLEELKLLSVKCYVTPFSFAVVHIGLGEKDEVMAWLEKAYLDRSVWLVWLAVEPSFDSLRPDPRFIDLLQRLGLT